MRTSISDKLPTHRITRHAIVVLAVTVLACACGVRSNLQPGPSASVDPGSAIVVLGVKARHTIALGNGIVKGTAWNYDFLGDYAARSQPDVYGYLVWKLAPTQPGKAYGVTQITVKGIGRPPEFFDLCNGNPTMTFEAPAGKVVYVGDLEFEQSIDRRWLQYKLVREEDRVRDYLAKHYPSLAGGLVISDSVMRTMRGMPCLPNVPMLISIPVG